MIGRRAYLPHKREHIGRESHVQQVGLADLAGGSPGRGFVENAGKSREVLDEDCNRYGIHGDRHGMEPSRRMTTDANNPSLSAVSTASEFSSAEIEAGRRLFARDWQFVSATDSPASLPPMRGLEIAFAGRSNVGKSSLINALTGHGTLARTSNTPGRTQELIFFRANTPLSLVDMPGYGYA